MLGLSYIMLVNGTPDVIFYIVVLTYPMRPGNNEYKGVIRMHAFND